VIFLGELLLLKFETPIEERFLVSLLFSFDEGGIDESYGLFC